MYKSIVVAVAMLAYASLAPAQPKAAVIQADQAEAVVTLLSIDREARSAVVQGPSGATFTLLIPQEAQNLDAVKPGDRFRIRYVTAVALALQKGGVAAASEKQAVELARKGATPGGRIVSSRQLTASVREIDRGARTLTLVGPGGNAATVKVRPEVRAFEEVAIGDTVTVSYTEAAVMEMVRETAAGEKGAR